MNKLPKDFPDLDDLLKRMGVPFQPFVGTEKKLMTGPGITVGSDDVEVALDGTLEYQGRKVVLYIRDVKGHLPKYHVVGCHTLSDMRSKGKYKRYVVTRRTDGEFLLNFADNLLRDEPETHQTRHLQKLSVETKYEVSLCPRCFPLNGLV